jgi:indolepyruvate decarboxylase
LYYLTFLAGFKRVCRDVFVNTAIKDVLAGLVNDAKPLENKSRATTLKQLFPLVGNGKDSTTSANFYPRLQRQLKSGDTVVIETGTCMLHLNKMLLPEGVSAEGQVQFVSLLPARLMRFVCFKMSFTF